MVCGSESSSHKEPGEEGVVSLTEVLGDAGDGEVVSDECH